ncbi:MAG: hypothetical protein PT944_01890 [Actinomycetaceae bacterium]|nr:hypothetical protein [Actinomycetaceae bacterium]MDY5273840.1 hypothetical protein [Arcanobacterium sp.]
MNDTSLTIEILYPELANLYGELANAHFLARAARESGADVTIIETPVTDTPHFLDGSVDFVYIGAMPETAQVVISDALRPHTAAIRARIDAGQIILATGNAVEIFGQGMESADLEGFQGLGLFPALAHIDLWKRHNSFYVGTFERTSTPRVPPTHSTASIPEQQTDAGRLPKLTADGQQVSAAANSPAAVQIVGFKSQFGHSTFTSSAGSAHARLASSENAHSTAPYHAREQYPPLFRTIRGMSFSGQPVDRAASTPARHSIGSSIAEDGEGVRIQNFMGTYLIGPLLILSPLFTQELLRMLGIEQPQLPYEDAVYDAFDARLHEFMEPTRHFSI